jgi:thiol-disulfide isomerase/thioredoxin
MKNKFYTFALLFIFIFLGYRELKGESFETQEVKREYNFSFIDLESDKKDLIVKDNHYEFIGIEEPIILVNFLATWCPPCIGQIPHLNNLQKRYKKELFILGTLIYDEGLEGDDLRKFIDSQKINFYISKDINNSVKFGNFIAPKLKLKQNFSLPLMILFVKGEYYTHYEGSIPEEMIESDMKQALKKIKGE